MRRWLKRIVVAGVTLVAVAVAFILAEHTCGRWRFSRRVSALESEGAVLSVTALELKRPPADRNSALRLMSLSNRFREVLTAIAAARCRRVRGNEPPDLSALAPRFLPILPRAWMDGKPLRYRLRPRGGFLLFPVGGDGKEDKGDPAPSRAERVYRQLADGRDAVWPVVATDAEAEAARRAKNE